MDGTFRVARIAGIDIRVHYTWVFAFFLITWTLAAGYFPQTYPDWDRGMYIVTGAISALLLFVSVLIHELAHSFVALAKGLPVHGITLFIFGGVSEITLDAEEASDEFLIAIVGPLTSLVLAGIFWGLDTLTLNRGIVGAVLGYLTFINVTLALFNLVPGFPLDGGRVLRSIVWGVTKDFGKATRFAAATGQFIAFFLIAWGVIRIFSGDVFGGLWTAFIGWFLNGAAESSRRDVTTRETFRGVPVRDLMERDPESLPPNTTVEVFVREYILQRGMRAVPVTLDDRLLGIVSLTDVKQVDEARWPDTAVAAIMTRPPLLSVGPNADASEALQLLTENGVHQLVVNEDGRLVGLLTRAHLLDHLQMRQELGVRGNRWRGETAPR